jgi:hypothetical protein
MGFKKQIINELRNITKQLIKENDALYSKARTLFMLNQNKLGYTPEFERLHGELSNGLNGDIDLALRHFNTAEEFADYIANKREKTGEYVWPTSRRNDKSDAELTDWMGERKRGL